MRDKFFTDLYCVLGELLIKCVGVNTVRSQVCSYGMAAGSYRVLSEIVQNGCKGVSLDSNSL